MIRTAVNLYLTVALVIQPALLVMGQSASGGSCGVGGDPVSQAMQFSGCSCCSVSSNVSGCDCCGPKPSANESGPELVRPRVGGCCSDRRDHESLQLRPETLVETSETSFAADAGLMGAGLLDAGLLDDRPLVEGMCVCDRQPQPFRDADPHRGGHEVRDTGISLAFQPDHQDRNLSRVSQSLPRGRPGSVPVRFSQFYLCIWRL